MNNTHMIAEINGYYQAYDLAGVLVACGKTWDDCYNSLVRILVEEAKNQNSA
nr:MAG TPA: hypothetical protein [Caudoviricetes sp.]